jgi:histone deacetylase 1/2
MSGSGSLPPLDAPGTGINARPSQPKKVAYLYDSDIGCYAYGAGHVMKPHRVRLTHDLVMNYGLYKKLEMFRARRATPSEMTQFHTDEYVEFLSRITPDMLEAHTKEIYKFNLAEDNPVFDGVFEFSSISAGNSMEGAARLNRGRCDIAINWSGGLHHAKKSEANGFCYINGERRFVLASCDASLQMLQISCLRFSSSYDSISECCILTLTYITEMASKKLFTRLTG